MKTKKNIIKISLIVVALVAAVLGVVLLQKILSPPTIKEFDNQYLADLEQRARSLDTDDTNQLVKEYNLQLDRIQLMKEKGLISEDEEQARKNAVLDRYVKSFFQWCDRKFSNSQWYKADLDFMRSRVQDRNVSNYDSIKLVSDVLVAYNYVDGLLGKHRSISSSQDIREDLAKVENYKSGTGYVAERLRTCDHTKDILNRVRGVYQDRHKKGVQSELNKLTYVDKTIEDDMAYLISQYNTTESAIQDYQQCWRDYSTFSGQPKNNWDNIIEVLCNDYCESSTWIKNKYREYFRGKCPCKY